MRLLHRALLFVVIITTFTSLVLVRIAPSAGAVTPDPGVQTLVQTLDGASNSLQAWTQGLATVGKLAEGLPGVGTSAGSVLGFSDLLHQWFNNGTKHLAAASQYADLNIDQDIDLGGSDGRTGHLTTALTDVAAGKQLHVDISASKTLANQGLSVPLPIGGGSSSPQSAFTGQGGVNLTVSGHFVFDLVWDSNSDSVSISANGSSSPGLNVDAVAHFGTLNDIHASIGILGVSVKAGSTLDLAAHFAATVSDPNNDGKLEFVNGGELAQNGSLAGLVSFGFANPAGALNAHLLLGTAASASPVPITLPPIDATIDVAWPNISTGSPTVTPTGIDVAGKFLNMTPRDLAEGIGQLVTSLTQIERSKIGNFNLPFLKGTLADAIQLNESLKQFLHDNTVQGDPAQAGHPTFVSLQELLDRLNTATGLPGGATIGVSDVHYSDTKSKLDFKISLHRAAPGSGIDLNTAAAAVSGGAGTIYAATTLTDNSQSWTDNQFAGRHVVSGASGGTIVSNTAHTLTLQSPGWTPTTPVAGSPYAISGMEGDVGVVALGDDLKTSGKGVAQANAVNATAKVKPSYDASIVLVLDLQNPTPHDPPLEQTNPDGSKVLVSATPVGADRVLLRTGGQLFTADLPITADVDLFANAGFLQVRLQGTAKVCKTNPSSDCSDAGDPSKHMLDVSLKQQGDADGDITFGDVVTKLLNAPSDLLDYKVNVAGAGSVNVSVPDAPSFFPAAASASFHWDDVTTGTPQFDLSGLSKLTNVDFDPSNPKQLFSIILKTLQTLDKAIGDADPSGASIFSQQIPVVGRSLRDLLRSDESGLGDQVTYDGNSLTDNGRSQTAGNAFPQSLVGRTVVVGTQVGIIKTVTDKKLTVASNWASVPAAGTPYIVRSELDDVISILQNSPSDNLQALVKVLNDRLGHTSPVTFAYADDAKVNNTPSLVINIDWKRGFHTSAPVQFDFNLPIGDQKLAGAQGSGLLSLTAGGEIKIGLVVPLAPGDGPADASALKILDDSHIGVNLDASVDNASIATTIGPLSLALGDPTSTDKAKAKASYSVDLAKSGATGTAQSFSNFLSAVGPNVNGSSQAVTCGLPDETDNSMALCATLPLYISTDGGTTYSKLITGAGLSNSFSIRLPKSASPVTDYFDLTGAQIDGHDRLETPDPTELGNAIQSHLIDLSRIDGIDGFLNLLVTSLNTASFGGKLPLVGDDLQQGADFLSNLKTSIDNAIGDLAGVSSISGLRDWVNNHLETELSSAGLNPDLVKVDTQCTTLLDSPAAPTVTPNGTGAPNATFTYAIVSYVTNSSGDKLDSQPGAEGQTTTANFAAVDASHFNDLSWASVTGAAGYKVYKKVGGNLKLLKDVGISTSYKDNGSDSPSDAPTNPSGPNPHLTDCDFAQFDSVIIRLDVSQGDFSGNFLNCTGLPAGHECIDKSVPLNIGIPGLSLRAATPGDGPHVQIGWRLHLAFGISRSDGFFVDTKDGDPQPEFALGLNFTLPSEMNAQLAFINITAKNCDNTMTVDCDTAGAPAPGAIPPLFGGSFKIDIVKPGGGDGRLTLSDLSSSDLSSFFDVKLNAGVNIDWLLKAKVGESAGFPGIQTELRMSWQWNNQAPGDNSGAHPLDIAFLKVQIDAGEVFGHVLGPVVNQIKQVTGPLDPVIKTLYAPIPVLSDLSHLVGGDDVTLVSIAKAFSTIAGGPDLAFIDTIVGVVNFINNMPACTTTCLIPIGSFQLNGQKSIDNAATPSNTGSLISTTNLDSGVNGSSGALGALDSKDSKGTGSLNGGSGSPSKKAGFSFPVFEHPATLFNVIMGGDVDLVKFDSGPLTLGFDWRQEFGPVYAPPPVLVTLHGSADVTLHIVAGFDTYGIRKAFEKARAGDLDIGDVGEAFLQSLFFYTTDDAGKPLPVVTFHGEIAAGAEVSAVIIKVGIEGGVSLTVSFLWNDPNHDGKFRISEFLQVALNNPICLFSVSGRVGVFLRAYITIGFSPFSVSFSFTIVDVTLLDFSVTPDCSPPPPQLAGLSGDGHTLVVYAGALGHSSQRGNAAYESNNEDKDSVKIQSLHDYTVDPPSFKGIGISMLGIHREFLNTNIDRVVVLGGGFGLPEYTKPMAVTFIGDGKEDTAKTGPKPPTASFDKAAIVFGGSAVDTIKTGIGDSIVDGRAGDDVISTSDRTVLNTTSDAYALPDAKAIVAGGGGNDSISVGNGQDTVAGDGSIGVGATTPVALQNLKNGVESGDPLGSDGTPGSTVSLPTDWVNGLSAPSSASGGSDGNDTVAVGLGQDNVYGNGGNDVLGIASDNPLEKSKCSPAPAACIFRSPGATIVGGTGNDNIAGGSGNDTVFTGPQVNTAIDGNGGGDDGSTNVVDTGSGNDTVHGSTGEDRVTGHSTKTQVDDIRGGGANDILVGGYGQDKVYGGPGDDYVIAEPSNVDLGVGPPPDDGFGPAYKVTHIDLPAGITPSSKTLVGGTGRDHIFGGDGGANIDGDGFNAGRCGPGAVPSDPVDESVNTVADGNDKIVGGAGVDNVRAGDGDDNVDVKAANDLVCGEKGNDTLRGGSDDDQMWGGSDNDTMFGDTGVDKLYGNDGNDSVYGSDGTDTIEGNNGNDQLFGGNDDDVVVGGTRKDGRADGSDVIYGDNGNDILIGDNGIEGGSPSGATVYDLGSGNASLGGKDTIYGGVGTDKAYGGLDDDYVFGGNDDDHIEGNNGVDHLNGENGQDDILGGTSQLVSGAGLAIIGYPDAGDVISGGNDPDVVLGDNGAISRPGAGNGTDFTQGRGMTERLVVSYDWANGDSTKFGGDTIHGDAANDVVLGEGGADTIHGDLGDDYLEGNQGADNVLGDAGQDDILGGSSQAASGDKLGLTAVGELDTGDALLSGGDDQDVVLGDNGSVLRTATTGASTFTNTLEDTTKGHGPMLQRRINLYDVEDSAAATLSGADLIQGDAADDVLFGQGGTDRIKGGTGDDHVEGGQAVDFIEGDAGDDDLVGGTSVILSGSGDAAQGMQDAADEIHGGDGNDLLAGDNSSMLRIGGDGNFTTKFTNRLNAAGTAVVATRWYRRLDLKAGANYLTTPSANRFGGDELAGGTGVDELFGQDGNDFLSGGPDDDYIEGNGGADVLRGDLSLTDVAPNNLFPPAVGIAPETLVAPSLGAAWPGAPDANVDGAPGAPGQDDLIGGSTIQAFRDGNDTIEGDDKADFELGDNGALVRTWHGVGVMHYDTYDKRYPTGAVPADAVVVRQGDGSLGMTSTRFCNAALPQCEPTGAFGDDTMFGDAHDDTMWGQDGNDRMRGGDGRDDMYGELGNDTMYGDNGQDAMVGDRGGIVDTYVNGTGDSANLAPYNVSVQSPPAISYSAFLPGTFDRRVDLYHDVNGASFVGAGTAGKMPHDGVAEGGDDHMRGGGGHDSMHGGFGDDVMNGDSNGDTLFGDDGADVMWGGKGCDPASTDTSDFTLAANGPCTDPSTDRGVNDAYVDYLFGGQGGASNASLKGDSGADIMDWQPRGTTTTPGTTCSADPWPATLNKTTTVDPCDWFFMTDTNDGVPAVQHQTHHGVDWMYGGWDRDIMQADQADEGPNTGDRLLDWNGAYNLYTHCNASYGGFNDVRVHSPSAQTFMQQWAYGVGAGQQPSDVTTSGTSAFDELALVYPSDNNAHGSGQAFPTTPGHFDAPNACSY